MVRIPVAIRSERDVNGIVRLQQAGSLQLLRRVECNDVVHVVVAGPWNVSLDENGTSGLLGMGDQVDGVNPPAVGIRSHHIEHHSSGVHYGRAHDARLRSEIIACPAGGAP